MVEIPPPDLVVPESITDVDESSERTKSSDDSLSEPELKKLKTDEADVEEEDEDEDDEEDYEEDDEKEEQDDGDEDMKEAKKKEYIEPSDEELLDYFAFHPDDEKYLNKAEIIEKKLPILRAYLREVEESDGFDIETVPTFGVPCGGLITVTSNYDAHFVEPESYYQNLGEWAIDDYNIKNGTNYEDVQYVKTNVTVSNYVTYYLTFTAVDMNTSDAEPESYAKIDARKTFQSLVTVSKFRRNKDPNIYFCRLKTN